jgi:DNA gyrase/topoisomerase IV subunit A
MEIHNHPEIYALNQKIFELASEADELERAKTKLEEELFWKEQAYESAKDELRQLMRTMGKDRVLT